MPIAYHDILRSYSGIPITCVLRNLFSTPSPSTMANSEIHTGFWIDHSRNSVLGATITLEALWGSQLVSASAIIVQIVGIAFWSIVAFIIHQRRSKPGLRDEYDAQLQVLLRNSSVPDDDTLNIISLGKAWAGKRAGVWKSALTMATIPAFVWVGFTIASILVGQITTANYSRATVLLKPGACGFIEPSQSEASLQGFTNVNINISSNAKQYARSCYRSAGSLSPISCSVYPTPELQYLVTLGA